MTRQNIQTIVNYPRKGDSFKQTIFYMENGVKCKKTITHYKKGSARQVYK